MGQKSKYGLQRTMLIYYLLIGFASLMVGVEFIADTYSQSFKQELLSKIDQYNNDEISESELLSPIGQLRKKALLMIAIIMTVLIIVLTMFIKNIVDPLQHMIGVADKISNGDLTQSISMKAQNELAELGNVINEMTANLQEMLLFSKNICVSGKDFIHISNEIMNKKTDNDQKIAALQIEIEGLNTEFDMLNEFLTCFDYLKFENSDQ